MAKETMNLEISVKRQGQPQLLKNTHFEIPQCGDMPVTVSIPIIHSRTGEIITGYIQGLTALDCEMDH